jgi:hypothetical protein
LLQKLKAAAYGKFEAHPKYIKLCCYEFFEIFFELCCFSLSLPEDKY